MTRRTGNNNNYSGPRWLFAEGRRTDPNYIHNQHINGVHTDCNRSTCSHWAGGGGVSTMGGSNRPTEVHHDDERYASDIEELAANGELGGPKDEVQYAEESEDEWL